MLSGAAFGDAGRRIVVEEFLYGEEVSFIALVDGKQALALASSQDHKARDEGDRGPNTGGMGAYSPAPVIDPALHRRIMREVIEPTVSGLAAEGAPFRGFLYAGLMIDPGGAARVLEFNCRSGDPETQPLMMRLRSDLLTLIDCAERGDLSGRSVEWDPRPALGVVLCAGGYPGAYARGEVIRGLDEEMPDTKVFHAGTSIAGEAVVTAGGRVLCVCALGANVAEAQALAYARADQITWRDRYMRRDIGHRAITRASSG